MTTVLVLSAVPAVLAAGFESPGLGLIAGAGLIWAAALYLCSFAPLVIGGAINLNQTVATTLSTAAAGLAASGVLLILAHAV